MKNRKAKVLSAVMGAAILPVVATLTTASSASAGIIITVTDLGVIHNAGAGANAATYNNFEAYDISLSTNDGGVITAVDFGQTTSSPNGILYSGTTGGFLQLSNYNAGSDTHTSTPQSAVKNGTGTNLRSSSFDSHFLPPSTIRADATAPFEDFNESQPIPGSNTNGDTNTGADFGFGTYLRGVFAITGANQASTLDLAYVVVPQPASATSGHFTVNGSIAESTSGSAIPVNGTFPAPVVTTSAGHPIVSLTAQGSQVAGYSGNLLPQLHVVGSNGAYVPAFDHSVNNAIGQAEVIGFVPANDNETYGLKLVGLSSDAPTAAAQIATIITDINAGLGGVTALVPTSDVAAIFPGYQIELKGNIGNLTADQSLGFDFTQETNVAGITVSDVAAVPEPASIAGLVLGASMLLGRRKRTA
jgi:hypothetical protein